MGGLGYQAVGRQNSGARSRRHAERNQAAAHSTHESRHIPARRATTVREPTMNGDHDADETCR
jgi:hypothetical protein